MSAIFKMAAITRHKIWALKIQHCPISSKFDMWVDNDVSRLNNFYRSPFSKWPPQYRKNSTLSESTHIWNGIEIRQCWICAVLWQPFWKWRPVEIFQCRDIIIYPHIKFWWYRTMLNFCGIVVAILKMATRRNFSISGHHYLPTYQILMISDNV
jgi:hypothetical protein